MDEIGTGGELHEDPWESVRYRLLALASKKCQDSASMISVFFASYSSVDRICSKTT